MRVASILNNTQVPVQLYLKWDFVAYESPLIELQPGQELHQVGPPYGNLFIRFNATPNHGTFEKRYPVVTADGVDPNSWGALSLFQVVPPGVIDLVLAPNQPFMNRSHSSTDLYLDPVPRSVWIKTAVSGMGAGAGGYFFGPQGAAVGAGIGEVVGGGMPAIKKAFGF